MKWYHSLKFKNSLFFLLVGALFVVAMILFFTNLKEQRLVERSSAAVTLATDDIVRELLIAQLRNEQIVEDMADMASVQSVEPEVIKKLLKVTRENEIVSGGLWYEPDVTSDNSSYFYHRENGGDFKLIVDYEQKSGYQYRNMEFYVLGQQLKSGETFWTKAYVDPVTKVRMITVVSPIYRDKKFLGVASLDIKLSLKQKQIFSDVIDSDEHYFLLADRVGELLIHSQKLDDVGIGSDSLINGDINVSKFSFLDFFKHDLSKDINQTLVQTLLRSSSDFTTEEANLLALELNHKASGHQEKLQFHSEIVQNDPIFHEPSVLATYYFPHTSWYMVIAIPEHIILKDTIAVYDKIMLITAVFAVIAALFGYILVGRNIVTPLESISEQIEHNDMHAEIKTQDQGEIAQLVARFNERNHDLLAAREEALQNERLLLQQSKMAAMGEMLDAVAHQWKQPLNALSMYAELIKINYEDGEVDAAYIEQFQKDIETQINHMTDTLGTFRSFFRPSGELHRFGLREVIDDVLLLAKDELTKNTIEVTVEEQEPLEIYGSENEFKHLLLNIVNNAKDAFNDNGIKERSIIIRTIGGETPRLEIEDSAGGIPEAVIDNVFKAHFTTKEEGKGTGIGLYMSSQIAEKHHAKLSVENREHGACFVVTFTELSFQMKPTDS